MNSKLLFRIGIIAMSAMLLLAVYLAVASYPFMVELAEEGVEISVVRLALLFIFGFIAPIAGFVLYLKKKLLGLTLCAGYAIFMTAASVFCIWLSEFNVVNVMTVILYLASAVIYLLPQTRLSFDPDSSPMENTITSLMWALLLAFFVIGPFLLHSRHIGVIAVSVLLIMAVRGLIWKSHD